MIYSMTACTRLEIKEGLGAMRFGRFVRLTNVIWKIFPLARAIP